MDDLILMQEKILNSPVEELVESTGVTVVPLGMMVIKTMYKKYRANK